MKKNFFLKILSAFALVSVLLVLFIPIISQNTIKVLYDIIPMEASGKISLISDLNGGTIELQGKPDEEAYMVFEMAYDLGDKAIQADNIAFELQYGVKESRIKAIEIYNHSVVVKRLIPAEIMEYFDLGEGESFYYEGPYLVVVTEDEAPSLIGNEKLRQEWKSMLQDTKAIRLNLFFCILTGYGMAGALYLKRKKIIPFFRCFGNFIKKFILYSGQLFHWMYARKYYVGVIYLLIVELGIILMALKSKVYAHADEHVTKMAIDYYLGQWLKPDPSGVWVAGTASWFGVSRLNEPTWYYLIAGKVGWLIAFLMPLRNYYRALGVILFGIMIAMTIKHGRKEKWMFLVLIFTPQLWYIFSYATSDAWDFFWSFIITFEILYSESCMNKFFEERGGHKIASVMWIGFIFSNLFLGKSNYRIMLLFAFVVLLFKLFSIQKGEKVRRIFRYLLVLVTTFSFYYIKIALNNINLYAEKVDVTIGQQIDLAYSPPYQSGKNFFELFAERNFIMECLRTFTGSYCWFIIQNTNLHIYLLVIVYFLLTILLVYYLNKCCPKDKIECIAMSGIILTLVSALIYWCWYVDFQPNGRYLLPIILVIAYISTKSKDIYKNVIFQFILCILALTSVFSYYFVALRAMVMPYMSVTKLIKEILRHG